MIVQATSDRTMPHGEFLNKFGIKEGRFARLQQVHGGKVVKVTGKTDLSEHIPGADAAVTDVKGIALSVRTADCLPVFFHDPERGAIGIAHAGWRSTKEGISAAVVRMMASEYKSDPSKLVINFGPALRQCCYEVNTEFLVHFPDSVVKMAHKHFFDIAGENAEQLLSAGVVSKNIYDCGICTSCRSAEYFSYRKEKDAAGRMLSVIMLD